MSANQRSIDYQAGNTRWLKLARVVWPITAAVSVGILIASIPGYLFSPILGVFEGHLILEAGTPAFLLTRLVYAASFLGAAGSIGLAFFLFLKKRADPMGLFLCFYLLGHGILFAGPIELLYPYWAAAPWVNSFILLPFFMGPMTMALIALFPDGRFVPPWSRWLIPISLLALPASLLTGDELLPFEVDLFQASNTILIFGLVLASAALLITLIYIQVYRYRFESSPEQRLQTKWVLYGIGLWMLVNIGTSVGWMVGLQLPANTPMPIWLPLGSLFWAISSLFLPISLTISITRYRMFEIDLIINRTLVYGALTGGVIIIYILVVAALGMLFQTQGNLLLALVATGVVAVVFQPLRDWLQRSISKLVFGERDDPIEVLSQLGSRLENTLAPDLVLPTLVETIAQSLKLPFVAIFLSAGEEENMAAAHGKLAGESVRFPLTYQGEDIGRLEVASRGSGEAFSKSEVQLLENIARQAGTAIRAVQLTDDLRRSRQQIVTAREEERRRLRRDLHDGIGPAMAGQTLKLDAALDLISAEEQDSASAKLLEATQLLLTLKEQTQESIRSIRRIVYGLRPPALDDLGLVPAIQTHVAELTRGNDALQVTIDAPNDGSLQLPAAVEVAVYRITLEALTNVINHSHANNCQIRLSTTSNPHPRIHLEITDDGVGLASDYKSGVGLTSMRGRATELGGSFSVESVQPSGTRVRADIPLHSEAV
jgi:signal transduction histidine kinase